MYGRLIDFSSLYKFRLPQFNMTAAPLNTTASKCYLWLVFNYLYTKISVLIFHKDADVMKYRVDQ